MTRKEIETMIENLSVGEVLISKKWNIKCVTSKVVEEYERAASYTNAVYVIWENGETQKLYAEDFDAMDMESSDIIDDDFVKFMESLNDPYKWNEAVSERSNQNEEVK